MDSAQNEQNPKEQTTNSAKFIRLNNKRHASYRKPLCETTELQIRQLSEKQLSSKTRKSVLLESIKIGKIGIFKFEDEMKEKENESDSENSENSEKSPRSAGSIGSVESGKSSSSKSEEDEGKLNINEEKQKQENILSSTEPKKKEEDLGPLNEKGELRIPIKTKRNYCKNDFDVIALSGKGAYGTVVKAKFKNDKDPNEPEKTDPNFYAIKIIDVQAIERIKKLYQAYLECDILSELNNPYIVNILGAFAEKGKIYIVMQYISHGDFSDFLRINHPLKDETIRFYAGEIVNFLEYIQSKKCVHRDLKPENIMMNEKYHLQVIDFATVRVLGKYYDKKEMVFKIDDNYDVSETDDIKKPKLIVNPDNDEDDEDEMMEKPERRGMTFVGTAEYVSPEVLGDKPAGFGADIWALGIMIYQMYCKKTPFKDKTNFLIFRKIEQMSIDFPEEANVPDDAKDLIMKILVKEPEHRLGAGEKGSDYDIEHLKKHPYFKGIDFNNLHNKAPPFVDSFDFLVGGKKNRNNNNNNKKNDNENSINKGEIGGKINISGEKENILRVGYLLKKSKWFHYNKRKMVLYSTPKLTYIDPDKNVIRGDIYLDKSCKVKHIDMDIFELETPKKTWRFKGPDKEGVVWEKSIIEAIKTYGK